MLTILRSRLAARVAGTALLLSLVAAPAAAQADAPPPAAEAERAETVRYLKKTHLEFTEVDIGGRTHGPSGEYVVSRKKTRFRSLLKLRASFRHEMLQSVGEL
jgi:hypothetical protein